jgi:D-3-phosphoglycerate dehydrogenase / 2-oxoglutarate reductase
MPTFRVALIDYDYDSLEHIEKTLAQFGAHLDGRHCKDIKDAMAFAHDADGVIIQKLGPVDDAFMSSLKKCKVLGRTGIGTDPIDVPTATKHGMAVVNVPSYCEEEVSDHAMAHLLTLARKTALYDRSVRAGKWDFNVGRPVPRLRGMTLGLIGFGKIPRLLVPKAKGFGLNVISADPYVKPEDMAKAGVEYVTLDALLARADFISVHAPLLPATRGMIGAAQFAKMKKTACIINTSRGPVIDEPALIAALQTRQIAGAGLDVLSEEPPPASSPLLKMENVVLTPHAGYYSEDSLVDLHVKIARNVGLVLNGKRPPEGLVNVQVLEKLKLV